MEILVTDQSADSSVFSALCSFVVVAQLAVGEELGGGVEGVTWAGSRGYFFQAQSRKSPAVSHMVPPDRSHLLGPAFQLAPPPPAFRRFSGNFGFLHIRRKPSGFLRPLMLKLLEILSKREFPGR